MSALKDYAIMTLAALAVGVGFWGASQDLRANRLETRLHEAQRAVSTMDSAAQLGFKGIGQLSGVRYDTGAGERLDFTVTIDGTRYEFCGLARDLQTYAAQTAFGIGTAFSEHVFLSIKGAADPPCPIDGVPVPGPIVGAVPGGPTYADRQP